MEASDALQQHRSMPSILRAFAASHPQHTPYHFLVEGAERRIAHLLQESHSEGDAAWQRMLRQGPPPSVLSSLTESLSYSVLHSEAQRIASFLVGEARLRRGDRAVLLFPTGRFFCSAMYGCMYAGVVPVPVFPPLPSKVKRDMGRLAGVAQNCGASACLTSRYVSRLIGGLRLVSGSVPLAFRNVHAIEDMLVRGDAAAFVYEEPQSSDLAFLQYSSGSTGDPKGVRITHGNLMAQLRIIERGMHTSAGVSVAEQGFAVSWLPSYHDMGLIGFVFMPLISPNAWNVLLMSPLVFLSDPANWLRVMTLFRAKVTGCPPFALDVCATRLSDEQVGHVDLSSLMLCFVGAEPCLPHQFDAFERRFRSLGLHGEALVPAYGLAEATLMVSCKADPAAPRKVLAVDAAAFQQNAVRRARKGHKAHSVMSCGVPFMELKIAGEQAIGEICIRGASVSGGYYASPEADAVLRTEDGWLRTGDLGFLDEEGQLYVTGRLKDLIIVRGRNYYPHDIEQSVAAADPAVRVGCVAAVAWTVPESGEEALVVLVEVRDYEKRSRVTRADIAERIVQHVASVNGVRPHDVCLLPPRSLLKTSSGKLQRWKARQLYEERMASANQRHDVMLEMEARFPRVLACLVYIMGLLLRMSSFLYAGGGKEALAERRLPDAPEEAQRGEEGNIIDVITDDGDAAKSGDTGGEAIASALVEGVPAEGLSVEVVRQRIVAVLALKLKCPKSAIATHKPLLSLGLDSKLLMELASELAPVMPSSFSPIVLFNYPTIDALAEFIVREAQVSVKLGALGVAKRSESTRAGGALAVVGIACRFPGGASGASSLWELLKSETDAVASAVPAARCSLIPQWRKQQHASSGGFLDESIASFAAAFFGMKQAEADVCDPQQRLLMKLAREALADAGYEEDAALGLRGGVFIGIGDNEYGQLLLQHSRQLDEEATAHNFDHVAAGNSSAMAANRISFHLQWSGPSVVLQTACSSSLVALNAACKSLRDGECSVALVGGVNLMLLPEVSRSLKASGFLSPSGRCRSFSAAADGYVRSEGGGMVLLQAANEGSEMENAYAVVRATAVSHNGKSIGLTAPSATAQSHLIETALRQAGVAPVDVDLFEAHGSGTVLGDAVEAEGIHRALGPKSSAWVSSVKANLGHLEAAAGIAGLIKACLCVEARAVPRHLHFSLDRANPYLDGLGVAWRIPQRLEPLASSTDLTACVASYGFGGANAMAVLGSAPRPRKLSKAPVVWRNEQHCWYRESGNAAEEALSPSAVERLQATLARIKREQPQPPPSSLMDATCAFFVHRAAAQLRESGQAVLPRYAKRMWPHLQRMLARFKERSALHEPEACPAIVSRYSRFRAEVEMLYRSGKRLAQVLSGGAAALSVIFPSASTQDAQDVYGDSPLSLPYSRVLARAVLSSIAALSKQRKVHLLEVGAGTGGLTKHVVHELLHDDRVQLENVSYCFTDISPLFVAQAKERWGSHSFMRFGVLDVSKEEQVASFGASGFYDVVLGANVYHATPNLQHSLRNTQALLAPGGSLCLQEITQPAFWLDLTFGLLEGWWLYDDDFRQGDSGPLLTADEWCAAVRAIEGFDGRSVRVVGGGSGDTDFQSVLFARTLRDAEGSSVLGDVAQAAQQRAPMSQPSNVDMTALPTLAIDEARVARIAGAPADEQEALLVEFLSEMVVRLMELEEDELTPDMNLLELGFDSLSALFLKSAIAEHFKAELPISVLTMDPSVAGVAASIVRQWREPSAAITLAGPRRYSPVRSGLARGNAHILAIGCAEAPYCLEQSQLAEDAVEFYRLQSDRTLAQKLRDIYRNSAIRTRRSCLPDLQRGEEAILWKSWRQSRGARSPVTIGARNAVYRQWAPRLARDACEKALRDWAGDRQRITHVVSVSCTGTLVPGIELRLLKELGLRPDTQRLGVNFMGCFGALSGLRAARALAESCPGSRVLLCCTELCTLHIEDDLSRVGVETFVSSCLFADGAAAVVLGCDPHDSEGALWELQRQTSTVIADSVDSMSWSLEDHGWKVGLSSDIPSLIADAISPFVFDELSEHAKERCEFAIHPGGAAILKGLEAILQLPRSATLSSWNVLGEYGNMSSCTLLYVLNDLRERRAKEREEHPGVQQKDVTLGLAFGPGLSIEGLVLRNLDHVERTQSEGTESNSNEV